MFSQLKLLILTASSIHTQISARMLLKNANDLTKVFLVITEVFLIILGYDMMIFINSYNLFPFHLVFLKTSYPYSSVELYLHTTDYCVQL